MTLGANTPDYRAPDGYFKNYTFDKSGQVFADGKALNGVRLDVGQVASPPKPQNQGIFGLSGMNPKPEVNPFQQYGGSFSRLVTDAKGNVFAEIGNPNTPQPLGAGQGTKGPNGMGYPEYNALDRYNPPQKQRLLVSGIALDPATMSRNGAGELGENQLYLRQDTNNEGLYFAQVNKGADIVAYAYSAFQQKQNALGGPEQAQDTNVRRQGGNVGGGVSPAAGDEVSLLGN